MNGRTHRQLLSVPVVGRVVEAADLVRSVREELHEAVELDGGIMFSNRWWERRWHNKERGRWTGSRSLSRWLN